MRYTLISVAAVLLAVVGWWGLYELTGKVAPDQAGVMPLFFALLFLARREKRKGIAVTQEAG